MASNLTNTSLIINGTQEITGIETTMNDSDTELLTSGGFIRYLREVGILPPLLPVSLSVSGNWTNVQYTNSAVDPTGLTFTCTYNDGNTETVTPTSISPSTWSSTVGTQTATFSYTENEVTVSVTKDASVIEPLLMIILNQFVPGSKFTAFKYS